MFDQRIYFAHSRLIFNSNQEKKELKFIKSIFPNTICPNTDLGIDATSKCETKKVITWATAVVCSEYKNHIGVGVFSELHLALNLNIPVFCIKSSNKKLELLPVKDIIVINRKESMEKYGKLIFAESIEEQKKLPQIIVP